MKLIKQFFTAFFICFLLIAVIDIPVPSVIVQAASAKINKTKKVLYINDTYTLKVTGTTQKVVWKSSNKKIATVSKTGKVTAKNIGTCTITAIVGAGENSEKLKCKITVKSRLSCDNTVIRCYADEYEIARINTKNLSESETLSFVNSSNSIVSAEWDSESDYHDIILVPDKFGICKIKINIAYISDYDFFSEPIYDFDEKDSLFLTVISYPDRSGWISEANIEDYGFTFLKNAALLMRDSDSSSLTGSSISFSLDPENDEQIEKNTYIHNELIYKIKNKKYYFNTENLEQLFLLQ